MDEELPPPPIAVRGRIYALPDLWEGKDDWTGVTSTAERKKRQNRLNQRAYRRRKKVEATGRSESLSEDQSPPSTTSPSKDTPKHETPEAEIELIPRKPSIEYGVRDDQHAIDDKGSLFQTCPRKVARIRTLIQEAYQNAMLRAPRPESLQMLIRINVTNAFARNAERMGFPIEGLCYDHYISPFNDQTPPSLAPSWESTLPASLQPTALQKRVLHHPWIDLFPFPRMRDNMLRAIEERGFDDDELCVDVMEIYHADSVDRPTLMVWGESWDDMGWEASGAFLRKWGWLLEGCPEVLKSTNLWREKRGETVFT